MKNIPVMSAAAMPFSDAQMREWGYVAWRCMPGDVVIAVGPMLLGNGRLFFDVHATGYDDFYCYDGLQNAINCMLNFDPANDKEPTGWKRHFASGRRRPGGDPLMEFVSA